MNTLNEFSTGQPAGLHVSKDGVTWIAIPQTIEAVDGSAAERAAVLDGFVADMLAKTPDVALVRASARMAGEDPAAAEEVFTAAQAATVATAADAPSAQPGGAS